MLVMCSVDMIIFSVMFPGVRARGPDVTCGGSLGPRACREMSAHIFLKMERLIYTFKAPSARAAAKVNIGERTCFSPNGLAGH